MSLFQEKFHQLAIYSPDALASAQALHEFGYNEWMIDEATLVGKVYDEPIETRARMLFNYQFNDGELEFLQYFGPSWHSIAGRTDDDGKCIDPFISHQSVYVDDVDAKRDEIEKLGWHVCQEFETQDHINPILKSRGERFKEVVISTRGSLGYDLKLIQRIFDKGPL